MKDLPIPRQTLDRAGREAGYALLIVVFLAALMVIGAAVAVPSILTQGKREMEEELIWRGQQYARAVRLYYRKNGRFPQALEDLTKAQNQIRFLRKPYAEPFNAQDGTWRLIYVGPNGQLIGSVRQRGAIQFPATPTRQPAQAGGPAGFQRQDRDQRSLRARQRFGRVPASMPEAGMAVSADSASSGEGLEGKVFGGNIIGVASKINKSSIRVFDGATTYREWEFIWDPSKDAVAPQGAAPAGQPPGKAPPGKSPNPMREPILPPTQP